MAPIEASANTEILASDNSYVEVDIDGQSGMYLWKVDNVEQLATQWFWYRIGNSGPEASINTLSIKDPGNDIKNYGDYLKVKYTKDNQFTLEIIYVLAGGSTGSHMSDIGETINIKNISGAALDFHFFQYTDFDLSDTPNDDYAFRVTPNSNTISQQEVGTLFTNPMQFNETITSPAPSHFQIAQNSIILTALTDGLATKLTDTQDNTVGNVSFAWEWDRSIGVGGTFQISKDKRIGTVPEPSTILLFSLGFLGLGAVGINKRRKI